MKPEPPRHPGQDPAPGEPLRPVGPGVTPSPIAPPWTCPRFEDDPAAWFAWLDAAVAGSWQLDSASRPCAWTDGDGRGWRVVVAPGGPEVRAALNNVSFVAHDLPVITAVHVTAETVDVEVTWRTGRQVVRLPLRQVPLLDLGLAMLTGTGLPHDAIARLGSDTWERARARWARTLVRTPLS